MLPLFASPNCLNQSACHVTLLWPYPGDDSCASLPRSKVGWTTTSRGRELPRTFALARRRDSEHMLSTSEVGCLAPRHVGPPTARHVAGRVNASSDSQDDDGSAVFLGFDFGTSGARLVGINDGCEVLFERQQSYKVNQGEAGCAEDWRDVLFALLASVPADVRHRVEGVSLDATSSTTLIVDRETGTPQSKAMMYNQSYSDALPAVTDMAPPNHTVSTGTSTLCKLVSWWDANVDPTDDTVHVTVPELDKSGSSTGFKAADKPAHPFHNRRERRKATESLALCHQADWLLQHLLGWGSSKQDIITTDYNNALKLGYDPETEGYPEWLMNKPYAPLLPAVVEPGDELGSISLGLSQEFQIPKSCLVFAGTTDSIAAFLASRVTQPGEAVTSLGSTMAVKLLSTTRVDDARFGVYSHRLDDTWLVGGASNTGGAVLRSFFSDEQLKLLSSQIDPTVASKLDYYPLLKPGERFPTADPEQTPRLTPRPASDAEFLHGLLESMARIEAQGYQLLRDAGASPLSLVSTAGGGSKNGVWSAIRERVVGVPVVASGNTDAAFGAALLARKGYRKAAKLERPGLVQAS